MTNYSDFTDTELANLLKSGNRSAFAEIYHRYKFVLHHHAWNKSRNKEEAQDALQDVFASLWARRETLNIGNNLSGYLYRCVRNQILNTIAHRQVQTKYIESIKVFSETQPVITDHRVRESMLKARIEREISALPPRMREVFELSRKHYLSHKEIAEVMGTSEQTVKKQMTTALRILRKRMGLFSWIMFCLLKN